jgi:LysR family transcriptional regulator for metE and metH
MIELRHLRSLAAIAETGRLVWAAERLHLTQSALSHQMRALEQHFGLTLFERTHGGLQFTQAGDRLLRFARETLIALGAAERDLAALRGIGHGELRIVLECHTCFDWLMPVLDLFRQRWPAIEVDLVSGFHSDPMRLLEGGKADLVIAGRPNGARHLAIAPLFRFEVLAILPLDHPLRARRYLKATDFADQTLISYPVPEEKIDVIREVLAPAGIRPKRRTAELTVAILQLVASRRGIAALPSWGVANYLSHDYVAARPIGARGLWSDLYAITQHSTAERAYFRDLVEIMRAECVRALRDIELLPEPALRSSPSANKREV